MPAIWGAKPRVATRREAIMIFDSCMFLRQQAISTGIAKIILSVN